MSSRSTLSFLKTETGAGALLATVALVAIAWANSPFGDAYQALTRQLAPVQVGPFAEEMTIAAWVKTALMPVFFFVVGLEIKHEVVRGELANPRRLALPLLAALGGLLVPAAIYLAVAGPSGQWGGWPAATVTDLSMALAALALGGPLLPPTLRTFLLTVVIAGHLAGVVLIGLLFTDNLRFSMLAAAAVTTAVLAAMARWRTAPYSFWVTGGLLLWAFTLKSGVDTSLAGIAVAFCLPLEPKRPGGPGVLAQTLEALHPYVAYLVLPLFVFTSAGFRLGDDAAPVALGAVSLGVAFGLFAGKQIGVFGATALAIALKWTRRPTGARWIELYAVAVLCGLGFTMSLYLGALAFSEADVLRQAQVRAGVILGSLASALLGVALLLIGAARRARESGG